MTISEILDGILGTLFVGWASMNYFRTSALKKLIHEHDLQLAYLKGKAEHVTNDVQLVVYNALKEHEKAENVKFDTLSSQVSAIHEAVAVIQSTIGRAINGSGKH